MTYSDRIIYLGDTSIDQQASYLGGIMTHYGFKFDYLPSDQKFSDDLLINDCALLIVSDYPSSNFTSSQMELVADKMNFGMAMLMIGGWESFTGLGGDYNKTPFADILPVMMKNSDDRVNFYGPCLVKKQKNHPILQSLPLEENMPSIGGLNSFEPKPGTDVLLTAVEYKAETQNGRITFTQNSTHPLLVIGQSQNGKTAAFASDVAPHWVGPLVDWGENRIKAQAPQAEPIEVGEWYAIFFANLIKWLIQA